MLTSRRRLRGLINTLKVCHRWTALIVGLLLVVVSTSGALIVYAPELVRATNADLFRAAPDTEPVGFTRAVAAVKDADPQFAPAELSLKDGVYVLTGDGEESYFVNAGTGDINGRGNINDGVVGFLVNLHDCALTCEGYSGYVAFLTAASPVAGFAPFADLTWGGLLLAVAGAALVVLAVTAPLLWWSAIRNWRNAFRLRWNRGRFARDFDLHNVIGVVALVPLLIWGLTGLNFEIPGFRTAWDAVTGAESPPADNYTMDVTADPKPAITLDDALTAAQQRFPGAKPTWVEMPSDDANYFMVDLLDGGPNLWAHNTTYEGNRSVGVDAHDAANVRVFLAGSATVANAVIDEWAQPALHYGVAVNPWWRALWFVLGLAPLLLMATGLSTWLHRRGVRRRRAARSG
jgi:uncharacterized iron-regulated membrane protein